uniref:[Histone H3]-lysine(27) N-trimethyltransferase n=1 Tax=Parastrongyloides trichosuri TaxID=131310 RepID=A0A0N4ZE97_PARTI
MKRRRSGKKNHSKSRTLRKTIKKKNTASASSHSTLSKINSLDHVNIDSKVRNYLKESVYSRAADIPFCCVAVKVLEELFDKEDKDSMDFLQNCDVFDISTSNNSTKFNDPEIHKNKTEYWKETYAKVSSGIPVRCPNTIKDRNIFQPLKVVPNEYKLSASNEKKLKTVTSMSFNVPTIAYDNMIPNGSKNFITTPFNFKSKDKLYYEFVCPEIEKATEKSLTSNDEESIEDLFPEGVRGREEDIFERRFTPTILLKAVSVLSEMFQSKTHDEILQNLVYLYPSIGPYSALKVDLESFEADNSRNQNEMLRPLSICPRCQLLLGCECNIPKISFEAFRFMYRDDGRNNNRIQCSNDCYLLERNMNNYNYNEEDYGALLKRKIHELYKLYGNNSCYISNEIVEYSSIDIKCFKVAKYINANLENLSPKGISDSSKRNDKPTTYKVFHNNVNSYLQKNGKIDNLVLYNPCSHSGPCSKDNKCPCAMSKQICFDACGCPPSCKTKFNGCNCAVGKCRTNKCPCFFLGWECLPSTCTSCSYNCSPDKNTKPCSNSFIQRSLSKYIVIKPSIISGNGAFAGEDISKGEFIIEYKGEIISNEEAERRGRICDAKNSSYLFRLNQKEHIDALYYGNAARFINHSSDNPNCYAKIMIVYGHHRIGIYASRNIEEGEELLFDYCYSNQHKKSFVEISSKGTRSPLKKSRRS